METASQLELWFSCIPKHPHSSLLQQAFDSSPYTCMRWFNCGSVEDAAYGKRGAGETHLAPALHPPASRELRQRSHSSRLGLAVSSSWPLNQHAVRQNLGHWTFEPY